MSDHQKQAGAVVHLVEEISDARLRCDQLTAYVTEALRLVENSPHKDHFFEVAGHLIYAAPATLHKLQKALQAVALAANMIDSEELKRDLRPEKVEQLERGLEDVRIRQVQRRSEPLMITPEYVAEKLRQFAAASRKSGLPEVEVLRFALELEEGKKTASEPKVPVADMLDKFADVAEAGNKDYARLAAVLRRMAGDNHVRELEAAHREFPELNALSQNIAKVLDVLKRDGQKLLDAWKREKSPNLQVASGLTPEKLQKFVKSVSEARSDMFGWGGVSFIQKDASGACMASEDEEKSSRFEEGKPADPTKNMSPEEAKKWKAQKEKHKDEFKTADSMAWKADDAQPKEAYGYRGRGGYSGDPRWIRAKYPGKADDGTLFKKGEKVLYWPRTKTFMVGRKAEQAWRQFQSEAADEDVYGGGGPGMAYASENEEKSSRFEEGKPADPTKNMSPEDAKKWKAQKEEHKDQFKEAQQWADSLAKTAMAEGEWYRQEFQNGDEIYFMPQEQLKNRNWSGLMVRNYGGRPEKAKKISVRNEGLWKRVKESDIPATVMKKFKSKMASTDTLEWKADGAK